MRAAVFHCVRMQINTPMLVFLKMGVFFWFWRSLSHKLWPWHCLYLCLFLAGSKWCSDEIPGVLQCYLERSSGGHLVQPPAGSRTVASTKAGQPWFLPDRRWKPPGTEISQPLWAAWSGPAWPYQWHFFFWYLSCTFQDCHACCLLCKLASWRRVCLYYLGKYPSSSFGQLLDHSD